MDPTIDDVYKALQAGKVNQAEAMLKDVMVVHPSSAKAHFMMAQVQLAKQNKALAKTEFLKAQSLDPSLKFADVSLVYNLKEQLGLLQTQAQTHVVVPSKIEVRKEEDTSMGIWIFGALILGGALILAWRYYRRKTTSPASPIVDNWGNRHSPSASRYPVTTIQDITPRNTDDDRRRYDNPPDSGNSLLKTVAGTAVGVGAGILAADAIAGMFKDDEKKPEAPVAPASAPSAPPIEQIRTDDGWDSGGDSSSSWDSGNDNSW